MARTLTLTVMALLLFAAPGFAARPICQDTQTERPGWLLAAPVEDTADSKADDGSRPGYAAYCEADCSGNTTVSCTATTCSAYDRNCNAERGRVVCDGSTTWCPNTCGGGGGSCTLFECRSQCSEPGCFSFCVDETTCTCDVICF